jgi:SEC-C motif
VRGGEVELVEKLGRMDPCPCGSGKRFQELLPAIGPVSTGPNGMTIGASEGRVCVAPLTVAYRQIGKPISIVSPELVSPELVCVPGIVRAVTPNIHRTRRPKNQTFLPSSMNSEN